MNSNDLYLSLKKHLNLDEWRVHSQYKEFYREDRTNHFAEELVFLKGNRLQHIFYLDSNKYPFENLKDASMEAISKTFWETFQQHPQDIGVELFMDDNPSDYRNLPWDNVTTFGWDLEINDEQTIVPFGAQVLLYMQLSRKNIQLIMKLIDDIGITKAQRRNQQSEIDTYRTAIKDYIEQYTIGWKEIDGGNQIFGYSFRAYDSANDVIEEINVGMLGFSYNFYLRKAHYVGATLDYKLEKNEGYREIQQVSPHIKITSGNVPFNPWGEGDGSIKLTANISCNDMERPTTAYINNLIILLRKQLLFIKKFA